MKEGIAGFLQLRGACASCAIDGNLEAGQALIAMKKIPFDKSTSDKNIVELGKLCHACCLK